MRNIKQVEQPICSQVFIFVLSAAHLVHIDIHNEMYVL